MTIGGGEAADQLVRMMLSGSEVAVRLGGSALKNMLALTMALAKNNKKVSGKINLGKMLRETQDLRRFPMTPEQYKEFRKLAKKHKLLYSVIRDKDDHGKLMDVILPVTELDRANAIFERILYTIPPEPERQPKRKLQQGREVFQQERSAPQKAQEGRQEKPQNHRRADPQEGREQPQKAPKEQEPKDKSWREAIPPKKGSRSEQDSPATKHSSSTPKKAPVTRMTSDRPSVEGRLKAFRTQLDQERAAVPTKAKTKGKVKPKSR